MPNWESFDEAERALKRAADELEAAKDGMPPSAQRALDHMSRQATTNMQRVYSIREWHHEVDQRKKDALAARIAEWGHE